jgi:hypothetical protein
VWFLVREVEPYYGKYKGILATDNMVQLKRYYGSATGSNPLTSTQSIKRKSRTLSPPSLPCLHPVSPSLSREESPLRRNPPSPIPSQPLSAQESIFASNTASRPQSNFAFSQTLSKFQSLAEQGTINGRQASTEVTQKLLRASLFRGV